MKALLLVLLMGVASAGELRLPLKVGDRGFFPKSGTPGEGQIKLNAIVSQILNEDTLIVALTELDDSTVNSVQIGNRNVYNGGKRKTQRQAAILIAPSKDFADGSPVTIDADEFVVSGTKTIAGGTYLVIEKWASSAAGMESRKKKEAATEAAKVADAEKVKADHERKLSKMPIYVLNDGKEIRSKDVVEADGQYVIRDQDGKTHTVKKEDVKEIKKPTAQ